MLPVIYCLSWKHLFLQDDCLLSQQDAFIGDEKETVDDVATTDTPVFSRKAT
jgi:hypothetical protein